MRIVQGMALLSLLTFLTGAASAFAQRETRVFDTSSGRSYDVSVISSDRASRAKPQDIAVIVSSRGAMPRPPVYLRVKDLLLIAQNLTQFRTNDEMVRLGFAARIGNAAKYWVTGNARPPATVERVRVLETRDRLKNILEGLDPGAQGLAIEPAEVHELALMIALGDDRGKVAYAALESPDFAVYAKQAGLSVADYITVSALIPLPFARWCSRWLGRESPTTVIRVSGFLVRGIIGAAGGIDLAGRVKDLIDGFDPGLSPLISGILFGDMKTDADGDAIRNAAAQFQTQYQLK